MVAPPPIQLGKRHHNSLHSGFPELCFLFSLRLPGMWSQRRELLPCGRGRCALLNPANPNEQATPACGTSLFFALRLPEMWSQRRELNPRPLPYHGSALPLSYIGKYLAPRRQIVTIRAEDETRTRDPQLGRLMLYQLSYFRLLILFNYSDLLLSR